MKQIIKKYLRIFRKILGKSRRKFLYKLSCLYSRLIGVDYLNIGGGSNFIGFGWVNLEAVKSSVNPYPFKLTSECSFPLGESCIKTVYVSHCLEHLPTATVHRVLREVFRVLKEGGYFVIKIPDFDKVLDSWRNQDAAFFTDELWGYDTVVDTWKNRNIEDCLDYRAAMIFCGFWNDSYGDHYAEEILKIRNSYHGPAVTSLDFLHTLSKNHTPSQISQTLSRVVIENEVNFHFNHVNAWSRIELQELLGSFGFRVISFNKNKIISKFAHIPGIKIQKKQSMYCWAIKKEKEHQDILNHYYS